MNKIRLDINRIPMRCPDRFSWAQEIMRFFDIPLIFEREKKAAIHLTSLVKQHKILKIK